MQPQALDPSQRKVGERPDVEVDHRELLGAIELLRNAVQAETRIVHDVSGLKPARRQFVSDDARWRPRA